MRVLLDGHRSLQLEQCYVVDQGLAVEAGVDDHVDDVEFEVRVPRVLLCLREVIISETNLQVSGEEIVFMMWLVE